MASELRNLPVPIEKQDSFPDHDGTHPLGGRSTSTTLHGVHGEELVRESQASGGCISSGGQNQEGGAAKVAALRDAGFFTGQVAGLVELTTFLDKHPQFFNGLFFSEETKARSARWHIGESAFIRYVQKRKQFWERPFDEHVESIRKIPEWAKRRGGFTIEDILFDISSLRVTHLVAYGVPTIWNDLHDLPDDLINHHFGDFDWVTGWSNFQRWPNRKLYERYFQI